MKAYIINDGDIEKLTLALDLSKFKSNFPLYKLQNKPDDMTPAKRASAMAEQNYPLEGDENWDDEEEEDEFESFDCHMDRQGYCGKAGSEECEFECPYHRLKGIRN